MPRKLLWKTDLSSGKKIHLPKTHFSVCQETRGFAECQKIALRKCRLPKKALGKAIFSGCFLFGTDKKNTRQRIKDSTKHKIPVVYYSKLL